MKSAGWRLGQLPSASLASSCCLLAGSGPKNDRGSLKVPRVLDLEAVEACKCREFYTWIHWKSKSDESSTLGDTGRVKVARVLHLVTAQVSKEGTP